MSDALIAQAFETTLKAWANAQTPVIPVAWENVSFNPPAGRYVRAHLVPNEAKGMFLEGAGRERTGIFQVDLCMPIGTGAGAARTLVDSLDAAFAVTMVQSGLRIWLLSPMSAAPPIPQPDRLSCRCRPATRLSRHESIDPRLARSADPSIERDAQSLRRVALQAIVPLHPPQLSPPMCGLFCIRYCLAAKPRRKTSRPPCLADPKSPSEEGLLF